jgi:hypothetical protein
MFALLSFFFAILAQTTLAQVPAPAHVVVVIEENHGYSEIIGSSQAPYINTLATQGALFTKSYALTHPSQPNYLGLYHRRVEVDRPSVHCWLDFSRYNCNPVIG